MAQLTLDQHYQELNFYKDTFGLNKEEKKIRNYIMEDLIKLKDAQIEALTNELERHRKLITEILEDFENEKTKIDNEFREKNSTSNWY